MGRKFRYVLVATGLFLALAILEQIRAVEPFAIGVFLTDLFEMALLAAAVAMTAFV